ncbi:Histone deacetylase HOS3 [Yarrowia sp. C11]|nr:Histone deacetylase HOS3 [Yarrowia sp. E02]KAG5369930.1 Histone deacetylase HOS3 [Yarrowia sp. C11]
MKQEPQTPSAYYTPHSGTLSRGSETAYEQRHSDYIKQEPGLEDGEAIDPALFGMGTTPSAVSDAPPSVSHSGHSSSDTSPTLPSTQFQTPQVDRKVTPETTPMKLATPEATPIKSEAHVVVPETPAHKIVASSTDDYDAVTSFKKAIDKMRPGSFSGSAQTLIVQSPLSYKHTFGRSWMGKKYKDSLVERPERLKATSLGVGAAIAHNPGKFEIEESVRQANLSSEHVTAVHGAEYIQLLEKLCRESKDKLEAGQLELPPGWPEGDIYLSPETLIALRGVVGAVERGVDALYDSDVSEALQKLSIGDTPPPEGKTSAFSQAFVNIRPPGHHCHACDPSGFCLINNAHVAIQYAAKQYGVTHAVILDFDLHHGDGSQDICWSQLNASADTTPEQTPEPEKKPSYSSPTIGYFSVHDINSFPTEFGYATPEALRNASTCLMGHGLAIWNVHLEPYETEEEFWKLYRKYGVLFEKANEFFYKAQNEAREAGREFKPLVVLSAGFDASEHEGKGMQRHSVNVPVEFYHRFSKDSAALASHYNGKLLSLLEGGYSDAALSTGVWSHLTGLVGSSFCYYKAYTLDNEDTQEEEDSDENPYQAAALVFCYIACAVPLWTQMEQANLIQILLNCGIMYFLTVRPTAVSRILALIATILSSLYFMCTYDGPAGGTHLIFMAVAAELTIDYSKYSKLGEKKSTNDTLAFLCFLSGLATLGVALNASQPTEFLTIYLGVFLSLTVNARSATKYSHKLVHMAHTVAWSWLVSIYMINISYHHGIIHAMMSVTTICIYNEMDLPEEEDSSVRETPLRYIASTACIIAGLLTIEIWTEYVIGQVGALDSVAMLSVLAGLFQVIFCFAPLSILDENHEGKISPQDALRLFLGVASVQIGAGVAQVYFISYTKGILVFGLSLGSVALCWAEYMETTSPEANTDIKEGCKESMV